MTDHYRKQMYLTEDYNSPQSVYWAFKSLIVIGISSSDDFWTTSELEYPSISSNTTIHLLPAPRQIVCNHPNGNHHFMISFAQFISLSFRGQKSKYGKFAYSSAFGFSVPSGGDGLAQLAPNNNLALSCDGTETWAIKHKCEEPSLKTATVHSHAVEEVPAASVRWYPGQIGTSDFTVFNQMLTFKGCSPSKEALPSTVDNKRMGWL